jgi:DNA-binding winged helix-turn-helix (wHTH) protein/TolB-like protein/Flp pilus assembly protein TadD
VDNLSKNQVLEFGGFRIDPSSRTLSNGGATANLTAKVFDTLLYLVTNQGRVVDKDELMQAIWTDTIVEENNLNKNISKLRQALGEKPGEHKFIVTIPGKGYKFVAAVTPVEIGVETYTLDRSGSRSESDQVNRNFLPPDKERFRETIPRRVTAIWAVAVSAVLAIAVIGLFLTRTRVEPAADGRVTKLAILPFRPLVPENRDEALEMGIAETLIARLGRSGDIQVRPLGSVRKFGGVDQDAQAAGNALGVDAVLDGSIQRSGDGVRVITRLLDIRTGTVTWNGTYDEQFTNIFEVQDKIAGRVADSLKVKLNASQSFTSGRTENPEAYRLYLQGRYLSQKITQLQVKQGIAYFQQAIDADPTYALAYAGMADAYRSLPINGDIPSDDVMPKARAAAAKALEIDPQLAEARIALGYVDFWYEHDWSNAELEFRRALELSPNDADAHRGLSILLTCLGRHEEAITEMAQARDLDPLSIITAALEGQTFLYAGRYSEAIDSLNKSFELDPNFWVAYIQMARIHIQQNEMQAAIAEAEKARQFSGGNSESISLLGYAAARSGALQKARGALDTLNALAGQGRTTHYNTALVYNGLGRSEDSIASLERAVAVRDVRLILLKVDPKWNNLRSNPRFVEIMRRLNF